MIGPLIRWWCGSEVQVASNDPGQGSSEPNCTVTENGNVFPADASLSFFIDDFLIPIAADGQLDQHTEQTPLLVAFHAYGIDEQLDRDRSSVEQKLGDAISCAKIRAKDVDSSIPFNQAWRRICQLSNRITQSDFEKIKFWFQIML